MRNDVNMMIGIPAEIRELLTAPTTNRGTACDAGAICAALLAKHLRDDPALIGSNRIGAVVERMTVLGTGGYVAGFLSVLEHLIVEGARHVSPDALAIQALAEGARMRKARGREEAAELAV